jgi:hypothetical protein
MPVLSLVRDNIIQKFMVVERVSYRGSGLVHWHFCDGHKLEAYAGNVSKAVCKIW